MAGKISHEENEPHVLDEEEQGGRGEIWLASVCLGLSLMCSALWLVLLVSPK